MDADGMSEQNRGALALLFLGSGRRLASAWWIRFDAKMIRWRYATCPVRYRAESGKAGTSGEGPGSVTDALNY